MNNPLKLNVMGTQKGFEVYGTRPATEVDLEAAPTLDYSLREIRAQHHEVARLLVLGLKTVEVAAQTGWSTATINNLQNNPMFKELLAHYQEVRMTELVDLTSRIHVVAADLVDEVAKRVREHPNEISTAQLRELTANFLDRAGYSPVKKIATATISAEDIQDMKRNAPSKSTIIIDGEATEVH